MRTLPPASSLEEPSARRERVIMASEFKARCLKLMDEVAETGEEIVITKNGRPISRLTPYWRAKPAPFGADIGRMKILGDIVSPMPPEWYEKPADDDDDLPERRTPVRQ